MARGGEDPNHVLEVAWHQVLTRWDEPAAHVSFLRLAEQTGRLGEAAMRYRGMSGDRERAEIATRQLAAITALALSHLDRSRTEVPVARRVGRYAALFLGLVFMVILAVLFSSMRS